MSHSIKHVSKHKSLNDSRTWDSEIEIIQEVLPTTTSEKTGKKYRFLSEKKQGRFVSNTDNEQYSEPEIVYEKPKDHKLKKPKIYDDVIATIHSPNVIRSIHSLGDGDSDKESRIDDPSTQQAENSILSPRKSKKGKSKKHRKNSDGIVYENLISSRENDNLKASEYDTNENVEKKKKKSKRHPEEFNVLDNDSVPIANGGENLISDEKNNTSKASVNENREEVDMFLKVSPKKKKKSERHPEELNVLDNDSVPIANGGENLISDEKNNTSKASVNENREEVDMFLKVSPKKKKKSKRHPEELNVLDNDSVPGAKGGENLISDGKNNTSKASVNENGEEVNMFLKVSPKKKKKSKRHPEELVNVLDNEVSPKKKKSKRHHEELVNVLDNEVSPKKKKKSKRHHEELVNVLNNEVSPKKKKKSERHHEELVNVLNNEVSPKKKKKSKRHHEEVINVLDNEVSPKKKKKSKRQPEEFINVLDNNSILGNIANGGENLISGGENATSKASVYEVNENMEKEESFSAVAPKKKNKSKRHHRELANVIHIDTVLGNLANDGENLKSCGENDTCKATKCDVSENMEKEERFSIVSPHKTKKKKSKRRHNEELTPEINNATVRGNLTNGGENYENLGPVYNLIESLEKGVKNTSKDGISPARKQTVIRPIYDLSDIDEENIDDPDTELSTNSRLSRHESKKKKYKKQSKRRRGGRDQNATYDLDEEYSSPIKSVHSVSDDDKEDEIDNPKADARIPKSKKSRKPMKKSANVNNEVLNHENEMDIVEDEASSQSENEEGIDLNEEYEIPYLHQITRCGKQLKLSEVKELREQGIPVKTGIFSELENNILRKNLRRFRKKHNLDRQTLRNFLGINATSISKELRRYYKKQATDLQITSELGRELSHRTKFSIYRRARSLACEDQFGAPMTKEQDAELLRLVNLYGTNFSKISTIMNLPAPKLYYRFRHERFTSVKSGHWHKRENRLLMKAVAKVLKVKKDEVFNHHYNIPWHDVAALVPDRTAVQCRKHWSRQFRWRLKLEGQKCKRFKISDAKKLVDLIRESGIRDEEEIDWDPIINKFSNRKSSFRVFELWKHLKSLPPGGALYMELSDYLDFLDEYLAKLPEDEYINYKLH